MERNVSESVTKHELAQDQILKELGPLQTLSMRQVAISAPSTSGNLQAVHLKKNNSLSS